MTDRESILGLLRLGWSIRRVARETGRRHETIRRYGQEVGILTPRLRPAKPHTPAKVPTDIEPGQPAAGGEEFRPKIGRSSVREHASFIECRAR